MPLTSRVGNKANDSSSEDDDPFKSHFDTKEDES
jgi:hypothetical protein